MTNLQGIRSILVFTLSLAVSLHTADESLAAKGGNGGGKPGGGDPPPAIVNYAFQRVSIPADYGTGNMWARNITDQGEIAGYYPSSSGGQQPFYYDINSGTIQLTNLNDISLDSGFDVPDGWYVYAATDINNNGDISGALARSDDPEQLQGFVLELRPDGGGLPQLHTIPNNTWTHTYASRINDAGVVIGHGDATDSYIYQSPVHGATGDTNVEVLPFSSIDAHNALLNNQAPAQVLTTDGMLYTLGDAAATDLNIDGRIDGFNDAGMISGSRQVAGRGNKTNEVGYIYDGQFTDIPGLRIALDLNENGDVVGPAYKTNNRPTFVHATHGTIDLALDGVVVFDNDADQELWGSSTRNVWKVSERDILGTDPSVADFPVIVGTIDVQGGSELFILQPVPVAAASLSSIPEPSGIVLVILASAGMLMRRRCTNERIVS